jgi:hypothetical protein
MEWKKTEVVKKLETRGNEIISALKRAGEAERDRIIRFEAETALRWVRKAEAAITAFERS